MYIRTHTQISSQVAPIEAIIYDGTPQTCVIRNAKHDITFFMSNIEVYEEAQHCCVCSTEVEKIT